MHFKILSRGLVAVVGCLTFAGAASDALAQQNSMFGSSGATGGGMGSATIGSSAFPTSKFPAAGSAAGTGVGQGAGLGAQSGMGAQPGIGATGQQAGGLIGTSTGQLIGTGAPAGQTGMGQTGQMPNRQGMQNRNNANRRPGGQNRNQMNQAGTGAGTQQKTTVRPQMVVAFDHPRPDVDTTQLAITTRFGKLASKNQFKSVEVDTDGNTVVLRGEVDSARTSRLATILARMEPGVKNVRNELTVTEPRPAPSADE
jgi:hypothetical protein